MRARAYLAAHYTRVHMQKYGNIAARYGRNNSGGNAFGLSRWNNSYFVVSVCGGEIQFRTGTGAHT